MARSMLASTLMPLCHTHYITNMAFVEDVNFFFFFLDTAFSHPSQCERTSHNYSLKILKYIMLDNNIKVANLWDCTTVRPKMRCMNYFILLSINAAYLYLFFTIFFPLSFLKNLWNPL